MTVCSSPQVTGEDVGQCVGTEAWHHARSGLWFGRHVRADGRFRERDGNERQHPDETFYGQEKVDYNAQLCLMNMAVHGLNGRIMSGSEANTFYHDAHNLEGKCDYVMANPPFNVDKVSAEKASNAGRLPFGLPGVNAKTKEISNANYLWISYFYAYLNERGRAGFVMASSATDSAKKDRDIRQQLVLLPESYSEESITDYRDTIYDYINLRYGCTA